MAKSIKPVVYKFSLQLPFLVGLQFRVTENDVKPSLRTVPKKAVKPLFWYIGNLYMPQGKAKFPEEEITECTFEVDWFHFHPLSK